MSGLGRAHGANDGFGPPPAAVVVDLDDTLFPQAAYLVGAARAVGDAATGLGLDGPALAAALIVVLAEGSDRGRTIDRALAACGVAPHRVSGLVPDLVGAFLGYRPRSLPAFPGVAEALSRLRARYPLACLTDGAPAVQRAKLAATGLTGLFDVIVITDELGGRAARKPHPAGLRRVSELLGAPTRDLVMIGDRPDKDMAGAHALGARSIRVHTGEYAAAADVPAATMNVGDFGSAANLLLPGSTVESRAGGAPEAAIRPDSGARRAAPGDRGVNPHPA